MSSPAAAEGHRSVRSVLEMRRENRECCHPEIGSQLRSGRPRTSCCNMSMAIPSRKARSRGSDQAFGSLSCPASGQCLGVPSFRGRPLPTIRIRPPACPHARDKPALLWQMRLPWPSRAEREKNAEQPVTLPRCVHPIGAGVGVSLCPAARETLSRSRPASAGNQQAPHPDPPPQKGGGDGRRRPFL